ncbi:MAG: hydroxyacylglutathione hydrolase [Halopseudomonas sp.]
MFQISPISAFNDNYIWMLQHPAHPGLAVAIDPGQAEPVEAWLEQHNLKLAAILVTHHHPDHTGGISDLSKPGVTIYGPANSPFSDISQPLHDGDQIELLGQRLTIKTVPGHTLDHLAYVTSAANSDEVTQLFCGDTLFVGGCGRLFEGSAEQMQRAMAFFRSLPDNTQICCAHEYTLANLAFAAAVEPNNAAIQNTISRCQQLRDQGLPTVPGSIAEERLINPFMRYDHPDVISAAKQTSGQTPQDEIEVLAAIRKWKDNF